MLFTNPWFFLLLPLSLLIYYSKPEKVWQISTLILASFGFYAMERPEFAILLAVSVAFNTLVSFKAAFSKLKSSRRHWAILGVSGNLLVLVFFKYSGLLAKTLMIENTTSVGDFLLNIPLPVGVSFFTFQGISLVVDSFKEQDSDNHVVAPHDWHQHSFQTFFYISFFPHLAAGPIVKAKHFLPQIAPKFWRDINWENVCQILLVGYFLKCVVADNLKEHTFWISYPYFMSFSTTNLLVLLFGYSMQIFADFAGYSTIAIGIAALYGYELPVNFNYPYISSTFSEFWTRWHMSLSSWLREYLYFSVGGNRGSKFKTYRNLMIVMLLGGLWHGAAWSYAVWGGVHGIALVIERMFMDVKNKFAINFTMPKLLRISWVFAVVTCAWLLFRLPEFSHATAYINAISTNQHLGVQPANIFYILFYSLPVITMHAYALIGESNRGPKLVNRKILMHAARIIMFFLLMTSFGPKSEFIYFQF